MTFFSLLFQQEIINSVNIICIVPSAIHLYMLGQSNMLTPAVLPWGLLDKPRHFSLQWSSCSYLYFQKWRQNWAPSEMSSFSTSNSTIKKLRLYYLVTALFTAEVWKKMWFFFFFLNLPRCCIFSMMDRNLSLYIRAAIVPLCLACPEVPGKVWKHCSFAWTMLRTTDFMLMEVSVSFFLFLPPFFFFPSSVITA